MVRNTQPKQSNTQWVTVSQLKNQFGVKEFQKGYQYFLDNRVLEARIDEDGEIVAIVVGSKNRRYHVFVNRNKRARVDSVYGDCSCPVSVNCKHVIAAVIAVIIDQQDNGHSNPYDQIAEHLATDQNEQQLINPEKELKSWDKWFQAYLGGQITTAPKKDDSYALLYILSAGHNTSIPTLYVQCCISRRLKKGGYGKTKEFRPDTKHVQYLTQADEYIYSRMNAISNISEYDAYSPDDIFSLNDHHLAPQTLIDIIKTGRSFWQDAQTTPLTWGDEKSIHMLWLDDEQGCQELKLVDERNIPLMIFPIGLGVYLDQIMKQLGTIQTKLPLEAVTALQFLPVVPPEKNQEVINMLTRDLPEDAIALPKRYSTADAKTYTPIPKLFFHGQDIHSSMQHYFYSNAFYRCCVIDNILPLVDVSFQYGTKLVSCFDRSEHISTLIDDKIYTVKRDFSAERAVLEYLSKQKILPLKSLARGTLTREIALSSVFSASYEQSDLESFLADELPNLRAQQWIIEIDSSFPVAPVIAVDEWYTEIEQSEYDWFGLELGIVVRGEKINLLPILIRLIHTHVNEFSLAQIAQWDDDHLLKIQIESGDCIEIPAKRVKNILEIIVDLFNTKSLDSNGKLIMPSVRAMELAALDDNMHDTKHNWFGNVALLDKAKQLANFAGIKTVKVPKSFTATLRPYQQEGLNWLQFLREHQFGGILADDMGLGKTVQMLAHLLVEKTNKRFTKPCLIIAPTSLMTNWAAEVARFAPELSVLVLHGDQRKTHFDAINDNDIVLTTYPLIVRDQAVLKDHHYYMLVLDEAQYVKNPSSKAYKVIMQLRVDHRVCLTGTPMENHLGELWALFNLVAPNLLGGQKQFKQLFKTPIEKHQDHDRQQMLAKRIKPFMLRRTKDKVAQDLPEKTIIVRNVELQSGQGDLYESIRLSMQKKVVDAISAKGLARSQIIILDALLKLRQTCCDPRLLSIDAAKEVGHSAKLDLLMEMLPALVEDGRRVLIFSSFAKMILLIEEALQQLTDIPYVKLTGSTKDRKTPINQFQNGEVPVFLISLKAGGTGLNLTTADTVIHYDPWWNPAAEDQATDRAHRIGQKNPVFVYKLITQGTVEEKIMAMQDKKRELLANIYEENQSQKFNLTKNDLDTLFSPLE